MALSWEELDIHTNKAGMKFEFLKWDPDLTVTNGLAEWICITWICIQPSVIHNITTMQWLGMVLDIKVLWEYGTDEQLSVYLYFSVWRYLLFTHWFVRLFSEAPLKSWISYAFNYPSIILKHIKSHIKSMSNVSKRRIINRATVHSESLCPCYVSRILIGIVWLTGPPNLPPSALGTDTNHAFGYVHIAGTMWQFPFEYRVLGPNGSSEQYRNLMWS